MADGRPRQMATDVCSFANYLDTMWRERRTNWNSSGDVFSTLNNYFNQAPNPYLAFLELVDCLPDATVDSPDTLYNCVWKHFCNWLEHRSRPPHHGGGSDRGQYYHGRYRQQHDQNQIQTNHQWVEQRHHLLTPDVMRRAAHVALKNKMKTFSTACTLFKFNEHCHEAVVEIFSRKIQELAGEKDYRGIATILDHQIEILSPSSLLDDIMLRKLSLFLICTNETQIVKKILSKVTPAERVHSVVSFIDSIVGAASQMEQDQLIRRELGRDDGEFHYSSQGMYTIAAKLTKDLSVPFKYYPNMTFVQLKGTTKFITSATFGAEAEMDITTFRESIQELAEMDERFPQFVVKYLIQFGYYDEAHYFAEKFKLDEILSSSSFAYWTPDKSGAAISDLPPSAFGDSSSSSYQLPLPDDTINFVDTLEKYRAALNHIATLASATDHLQRCVGMDTEWTPVHRPDRRQAISILQLALIDRIYIIDIENLSPQLTSADWQLLDNFFKSPDIKKLTYAFKSDLSMLKLSFPEAANLDLTKIVTHIDIERLTHHVWKALRAVDCGPLSLFNNTVVLDATSSAIPTSLTDVARAFLGRRVPKMFRLSNWSRRPLFKGQLLYAAVDAYCLLEIYREISYIITSQKLKVSPEISMLRKGEVVVASTGESPDLPQSLPGDVRLLCDALLTDVGAYLRQLGFNIEIVTDNIGDVDAMADRALKEQRVVVTVPHLATNLTEVAPNIRVIGVPFGTLQEQADFVASRLNVQVNCEDNKPIAPFDPIQRVQQIAARRREEVLYDISNDPARPPHEPLFTARCRLISTVTCGVTVETQAVAANKKEAKKRAAANMLVKLSATDESSTVSCSVMAPLSAQQHQVPSPKTAENYNCANNSKKVSKNNDFWTY